MEWLERNRVNVASTLVVLIAIAAAILLQVPRRPALEVETPASPPGPPTIKVHVVGAVASPGVYELEMDARLQDAIEAAGGPSGSVDVSGLNLAAPLRDGQQVTIPELFTDPAAGPPSASSPVYVSTGSPARLNLNTASGAELETLPGIGPVTAQKILDYRSEHGAIVSIEELRDSKTITASVYEKIKDLVEVR